VKAEIGFATDYETNRVTERMQMRITPQSPTEQSALQVFCRRLGWAYNEFDGCLFIEEQPK
jgi:hypothetical protein